MVPYLGISLYLGAGGQHKHELPHHLWLILVFLGLGILIFSILLAKGTFLKSLRFLESASGIQRLRRFESSFEELDASLGAMYRDFKGRYLGSLACFSFGWIAHAMEVALVFFLLGYSVSWRDALFISAMAQLGSLVALFIPAGLGVYEGGHYLAAMLLGLPTSLVLSVGLIRRLRQAFWDAAGLLLY